MNIIFMGTPSFAATILQRLHASYSVKAVVTRPDAIRGRGKSAQSSAVAVVAEELGVPVLKPQSLRSDSVIEGLASYEPDVICVAAYGAILPKEVLELPRYGCINVHGSLLPRWRGAAPMERAILTGDAKTGVCIMTMEEGLDTGDYCLSAEVSLENMDLRSLEDKLARLGGDLLVEALDRLEDGSLEWTAQEESAVTYAEKIDKGELFLDPCDEPATFERKVRASSPAHPAKLSLADRGVTILAAQAVDDPVALQVASESTPGDVRFQNKRLFLRTGSGIVELLKIKPDGKKEMDAKAFAGGIQGIKNGNIEWGGYER